MIIREGSAKEGFVYQQIPSMATPAHRQNTQSRITRILELASPKSISTVLDLGCANGVIAGELGKTFQQVVGVDYDEHAITIARASYNHNVRFQVADISPSFIQSIAPQDLVLWISQFNWMVKQYGMEAALTALYDLSTRCNHLLFETATEGDGEAPLDLKQSDIFRMLVKNTCFQKITDAGVWNDGWTIRHVFFCEQPATTWVKTLSQVTRVHKDTVRKTYGNAAISPEDLKPLLDREMACLRKLSGSPYFPKVVDADATSLTMSYEGLPALWYPEKDVAGILQALDSAAIVHRDVRPENLLFNGTNLVLIDFTWAAFRGELTWFHSDLGGAFKCPHGFNDAYSFDKVRRSVE